MKNINKLLLGLSLSCSSLLQASTIEFQNFSAEPLASTHSMEVTIDLDDELRGPMFVCVPQPNNTYFFYAANGEHQDFWGYPLPSPGRYKARGDFILEDGQQFPDVAAFRFTTSPEEEPSGQLLGKVVNIKTDEVTGYFLSNNLTAPGPNPRGLYFSTAAYKSPLNTGKCPVMFLEDSLTLSQLGVESGAVAQISD